MLIEGKYRILTQIGQSGYSKTYLVLDERHNKPWTLKVCDKNSQMYNSVAYESIKQEAFMIAKLDHPAIPRIVDIMENDRYMFIVREYIERETLQDFLKKYGAQSVAVVVEWGKQLCDVLKYLHSLNPPHIYISGYETSKYNFDFEWCFKID